MAETIEIINSLWARKGLKTLPPTQCKMQIALSRTWKLRKSGHAASETKPFKLSSSDGASGKRKR